jgi:biopolymer transport protein ExbD
MAKIKIQRNQPSLDMTPMVDLAFLLVTFFMLTTKFAPDEALIIDMPTSVSEIKLPDTDILTITISKDGIVFFNMDGQYNRSILLSKIAYKYKLEFTSDEIQTFSLMNGFGVPIGNLKEFLSKSAESRNLIKQPGIPCDDDNNELSDWIVLSRITNPKLRIAIKGDQDTSYPVIKKVVGTLLKNKVNRFNLITTMERDS